MNRVTIAVVLLTGCGAVDDELLDCWPNCDRPPRLLYAQSWEQAGCAADDVTASTAADCDFASTAADGSQLVRLDQFGELIADGAVGSLEDVDLLYFQIPIYFESRGIGGSLDLWSARDGNVDAYPRIRFWPSGGEFGLICDAVGGEASLWGQDILVEGVWYVMQIAQAADGWVELEIPGAGAGAGIDRFCPASAERKPRDLTDLGYAFRTGNMSVMWVDDLKVADGWLPPPVW